MELLLLSLMLHRLSLLAVPSSNFSVEEVTDDLPSFSARISEKPKKSVQVKVASTVVA